MTASAQTPPATQLALSQEASHPLPPPLKKCGQLTRVPTPAHPVTPFTCSESFAPLANIRGSDSGEVAPTLFPPSPQSAALPCADRLVGAIFEDVQQGSAGYQSPHSQVTGRLSGSRLPQGAENRGALEILAVPVLRENSGKGPSLKGGVRVSALTARPCPVGLSPTTFRLLEGPPPLSTPSGEDNGDNKEQDDVHAVPLQVSGANVVSSCDRCDGQGSETASLRFFADSWLSVTIPTTLCTVDLAIVRPSRASDLVAGNVGRRSGGSCHHLLVFLSFCFVFLLRACAAATTDGVVGKNNSSESYGLLSPVDSELAAVSVVSSEVTASLARNATQALRGVEGDVGSWNDDERAGSRGETNSGLQGGVSAFASSRALAITTVLTQDLLAAYNSAAVDDTIYLTPSATAFTGLACDTLAWSVPSALCMSKAVTIACAVGTASGSCTLDGLNTGTNGWRVVLVQTGTSTTKFRQLTFKRGYTVSMIQLRSVSISWLAY